jgi:hypothetical protein
MLDGPLIKDNKLDNTVLDQSSVDVVSAREAELNDQARHNHLRNRGYSAYVETN